MKKKHSDMHQNEENIKEKEDNSTEDTEVNVEVGDDKQEKGKKKSKKKAPKDKEKIEQLEIQLAELNDKHLRLYSEFDNFRKRTLKEKIENAKFASQEVIRDLLPVLDDFERAIKAFEEHSDQSKNEIIEGIQLIYSKLLNTLKAKGLESMETKEKEFDTDFHEAITQIPAPNADLKGKVMDEVEKGYLLNGKVIRYAKVVVGS
jgi:molecular chaperone GrpE